MAKQVLDLYELYRLVVARGGLVEVINKKIWREITKGLNLPSSITSAAFTLRTQYMKYLYPYECDKEKLSHPDELQAAIDGNRREGRRSSYNHFNEMLSSGTAGSGGPVRSPSSNNAPPLSLVPHRGLLQLNGGLNGNNNNLHGASSGKLGKLISWYLVVSIVDHRCTHIHILAYPILLYFLRLWPACWCEHVLKMTAPVKRRSLASFTTVHPLAAGMATPAKGSCYIQSW